MQRKKNCHQQYEHIWVDEFSYSYQGSEQQKPRHYLAHALTHAQNQHQALVQLSDHILHSLQADKGQYEKILPFLQYLDMCHHLEKQLILNVEKIYGEQPIIVLNTQDISEPLPIDTGSLEMTSYPCPPFTGENPLNLNASPPCSYSGIRNPLILMRNWKVFWRSWINRKINKENTLP
ncbi:hypothetical protein ABLB84_14650 [Xenorhabdus szentirmaii]|uniref:hypothetical protein n=1 Tax=Xenorhabdus szentirmaii TaxID=290112 RepID=UPI0032B79CDD